MKNKVIVLAGPTASGKSSASIQLAKALGGEIISADASQIYRELNIGTAKIKEEEKQGITHHLLDICHPLDTYSVKNYQDDSRKSIHSIHKNNKIPILCGGTGLYINACIYPYVFQEESKNDLRIRNEIRTKLEKMEEEYGNSYLVEILNSFDPHASEKIDLQNPIRVKSSIEYFLIHGCSKYEKNPTNLYQPLYEVFYFCINWDRAVLYETINQRVELMLHDGLIEEVEFLLRKYPQIANSQSFQAIGYKEVTSYLEGKINYDLMKEMIQKNTRNYAKRQLTWFRKDKNIHWISMEPKMNSLDLCEAILDRIRKGVN